MNNSVAIALLMSGALVVVLLLTFAFRVKSLLPCVFHNAAWAVAFAVYSTGLMNYYEIPVRVWLLFFSGIIAFNLGCVLTYRRKADSREIVSSECRAVGWSGALVTPNQFRILLALYAVGVGIYLYTIAQNFGLEILLKDPVSVRSTAGYLVAFPIYGKMLYYLGPLCFILAAFPSFVGGFKGRISYIVIAGLVAVSQLALLQRTNLFICLAWAAGIWLLRNFGESSTRRRKGVILQLVATVFVAGIAFQGLAVALGKTGSTTSAVSMQVDPRIQDSNYTSVLHYSSSGLPAFSALVQSRNSEWPPEGISVAVYGDYNPQTWGAATFSAFMKLVPFGRGWNPVAPFVEIPVPTNVFTWFEPWYRDFREPGIILGALLLGMIVGHFSRRVSTPESLALAGLLVGLTAFAAFVNKYLELICLTLYFAVYVLGYLRRRSLPQGMAVEDAGRQPSWQSNGRIL